MINQNEIAVIGRIKGVTSKTKEKDGFVTHTLEVKMELVEGWSEVQNISDLVKEHVQINFLPKQLTITNSHQEDSKDEE